MHCIGWFNFGMFDFVCLFGVSPRGIVLVNQQSFRHSSKAQLLAPDKPLMVAAFLNAPPLPFPTPCAQLLAPDTPLM